MKALATGKKIWMAVSTVIIIGFLFAYYLLIYIPNRENELIKKKFRTLQQVGVNFIELKENYENAIIQVLGEYSEVLENCHNQKDTSCEEQAKDFFKTRLETHALKAFSQKEVNNERLARPEEVIFAGKDLSHTSPGGHYHYLNFNYSLEVSEFISKSKFISDHFNRFLLIRMFHPTRPENAKINISTRASESAQKSVIPDSTVSIIAYQGNNSNQRPGSENKISIADINTLFEKSQGFQTIPVHTIKISGTSYKLFAHIVQYESDEDWVLCGLVQEKIFEKEVRSVQLIVLVFFTLSLIFLLLAMPILKLMVMSAIERLQIVNVWFIGFSIVIGTSVIFLILFTGNHYLAYEHDYNIKLRKLSDSVESNFSGEIGDIINQLKTSESLRNNGGLMKITEADFWQKEYILEDISYDKVASIYPFFNETMWLNDSGSQVYTLATHKLNKRKKAPNLWKREYFRRALNNDVYPLYNKQRHCVDSFCIQSIFSWHNLLHEAGISVRLPVRSRNSNETIQSPEVSVLSMATKLHSVMNPILPPGYQFCIVDPRGKVLFHSQTEKNLQENFFDEIENEKSIAAAVSGRLSIFKSIQYNGKNYQAYIRPLDHQPMYLITLYDRDYYKTPLVLTLGFSVTLVTILFLVQGVQVFLLFLTSYHSTKLRIRRFFLSWLRPHVEDNRTDSTPQETLSYKERYARAIVAMSLIFIIMILISYYTVARYLMVAFITLPLILLAFHYILLRKDIASLNFRSIALHPFLLCSTGLIILINILAFQYFQIKQILFLVALQALLVGIMVVSASSIFNPYVKGIVERLLHFSSYKLYVTFLIGWLILVAVIPVSYFYKVAFYREQQVWTRYIQWKAYQNVKASQAVLLEEWNKLDFFPLRSPHRDKWYKRYVTHVDHYGNYLTSEGSFASLESIEGQVYKPLQSYALDSLEFAMRPAYNGPLEESRVGLSPQAKDKWWSWSMTPEGEHLTLIEVNDKFKYASVIPSYSLFKGYYGLLFFLVMVIVGFLIWAVIVKSVKSIYGITLIDNYKPRGLTAEELKAMINSARKGKFRVFVVGLPFSGKSTLMRQVADAFPGETEVISMRDDKAGDFDLTKHIYIVHHFEHGINDHVLNERKYNILQKLQKLRDVTLIIGTAVQPTLVLEVYERKIERLVEEKKHHQGDDQELGKRLSEMRNAYRIWKNILAGFQLIYHPLQVHERKNAIDSELAFGTYLPKIKRQLKEWTGSQEDLIMEVEEIAEPYYHALWNSFSREEKHMLYDLAKDRFVNMRNLKLIRLLIKKGVMIMDDSLHIMNKSFNNFILAVVKEDEEMSMTQELQRKGTWHSVQLILVIMLISIAVFIAVAQQEWVNDLNIVIGVLGSLITLLARFGGVFGGAKVREGS